MTIEQERRVEGVTGQIEAATCACGKLLADCQCENGEECECGGDPALCHANESKNAIEMVLPKKT